MALSIDLRARRWCKFLQQVVDSARNPFWRFLYFCTWSTGPLYNLRIDSSTFSDSLIGYPKKQRRHSANADPSVPCRDSVWPEFDPKSVFPWKAYCRHHCINRLEFRTDPTVFNPIVVAKLGSLGAKFLPYSGNVKPQRQYRAVRGERSLLPQFQRRKLGYFEVTFALPKLPDENFVSFGLATSSVNRILFAAHQPPPPSPVDYFRRNFPLEKLAIGWSHLNCLSVAFHCDDGRKFSPSDDPSFGLRRWNNPLPPGKTVMGCGINFMTNEVFFTRDGVFLGIAYHHDPAKVSPEAQKQLETDGWRPYIAVSSSPVEISCNFGQNPFAFDLKSSVMWERFGAGPTQAMVYLAGLYDEMALIPYESL